ncbi:hypothetical protein G6045_10930 [Streptomyces sp. YC504]|uniref:Uncharacterized protein n=1 Tax=Streptomyces mesophilus TaxID=1775132 RepID=A0A6G4XH71_9ACTN|nr:hypothetical protein [Streptomyces mesophilus]NGO76177.1 hypothetical protein [Streptomyces mesophilus]
MLPETCELPYPDPPARAEAWSDDQLRRWVTLWQSPAANLWDDASAGMVALLVELEALGTNVNAAQLTEIRRISETLLITSGALAAAGYALSTWPTS